MIIEVPWIDFILFLVMFGLMIYVLVANEISSLHKSYLAFHLLMMMWPLSQFIYHMSTVPIVRLSAIGAGLCSLLSLGPGWFLFTKLLTQQRFRWTPAYTIYLILPISITAVSIGSRPEWWFVNSSDDFVVNPLGPLFLVYVGLMALYFIPTLVLMLHALMNRRPGTPSFRKQISLILMGMLVFIACALLDLAINVVRLDPDRELLGATSVGILLSNVFFIIVIQRYRALEITWIGRRDAIAEVSIGIVVLDERDQILDLNRGAKALLATDRSQTLNIDTLLSYIPVPDERERVFALYQSGREHEMETELAWNQEMNGNKKCIALHISPIYDDKKNWIGRLLTFHDVTQLRTMVDELNMKNNALYERNQQLLQIQEELHQANRRLEHLAVTDPLTGCYNRRHLLEQMEHYMQDGFSSEMPFSLVLFDIDHFKVINDTYGHVVGDEVLIWTSRCVSTLLHTSDLLARYGGEEFAVFMPGVSFTEAYAFAERLSELLRHSITEDVFGFPITVSVSIGIVSDECLPRYDSTQPSLPWMMKVFEQADQLMYQAKEHGRDCIMPRLNEKARIIHK